MFRCRTKNIAESLPQAQETLFDSKKIAANPAPRFRDGAKLFQARPEFPDVELFHERCDQTDDQLFQHLPELQDFDDIFPGWFGNKAPRWGMIMSFRIL